MKKSIDKERKQVNITLMVQAKRLFKIRHPLMDNVEFLCKLSDDNGGNPGSDVSLFTSQVYINTNVRWRAVCDDDYEVAIDSIIQKGQGNDKIFFPTIAVPGKRGSVLAKVRNKKDLEKLIQTYSINLFVWPKDHDDLKKAYTIDPKLQANS